MYKQQQQQQHQARPDAYRYRPLTQQTSYTSVRSGFSASSVAAATVRPTTQQDPTLLARESTLRWKIRRFFALPKLFSYHFWQTITIALNISHILLASAVLLLIITKGFVLSQFRLADSGALLFELRLMQYDCLLQIGDLIDREKSSHFGVVVQLAYRLLILFVYISPENTKNYDFVFLFIPWCLQHFVNYSYNLQSNRVTKWLRYNAF